MKKTSLLYRSSLSLGCFIFLLTLSLCLFSHNQSAQASVITFVNSTSSSGSGTTLASPALSTTGGNFLAVYVRWYGGPTISSVTDTAGNAFVPLNLNNNTLESQIFYAKNIAGGVSDVITVHFSSAPTYTNNILVAQYTGVDTVSPLDQQITASGSSANPSTATITTTAANELLFVGTANTNGAASFSAGANYIQRATENTQAAIEDRIVSSSGAYNALTTLGQTDNWEMSLAAFKAAGGTSPTPTPTITPTPTPTPTGIPTPTPTPTPTTTPSPTPTPSGQNIYLSQNGSGTQDASSCANAKPASFFNSASNWGTVAGKIGPGVTVHLCGIFTGTVNQDLFTAQGGGASGNPVIIYAEPGADFTSPAWGYVFYTNGFSHFILDGGTNGIIENTNNGSAPTYANQVGTIAISVTNSSDVEIKNWHINNLYVHTSSADQAASNPFPTCLEDFGSSSNIRFHDNVAHDLNWCVAAIGSGLQVYNNKFYHMDHGIGGGDANASGVSVHDNEFYDFYTWDTAADAYHHDPIHLFASDSGPLSNVNIYNNYIHGNMGGNMNACVYLEFTINSVNIFNNTCGTTNSAGFGSGCWGMGSLLQNVLIANNTCVSPTNSNYAFWITGGSSYTAKNNIFSCVAGQCMEVWAEYNPLTNVTFDYNDWYTTDTGQAFNFSGTGYPSFLAYQTASRQDLHSTGLNPNLNANFQPGAGSPALNAGINLTSLCLGNLVSLCTDPLGVQRPSTGAWDMGAYQVSSGSSGGTPLAGDLNLDHIINALDYSIMNAHWLQNFAQADINSDGLVNSIDFAVLKSNWGKTW